MTANHTHKKLSHYGRLSKSILNGVVGDYLDQSNNPLAIQMGFYHKLNKLKLDTNLTAQLADTKLSNRVVILAHGLTNLETIWDFPAQSSGEPLKPSQNSNYGTRLQEEFGFTPLFIRYNTGLPIETNGREFSELLETLFEHYPIEIDELAILGFSMGGLLLRHAQLDAINTDKTWLKSLSKCIYIGTPHEGSPLEKAGFITGEIVRKIPLDYLNHWAEWIDIRSQGIKDLKLGLKNLPQQDQKNCGSFYQNAQHYFISGSIGTKEDSLAGKALGDSLVRQGSALPSSKPDDSHHAHFENLSHIPLAHSEKVYEQIAQWMSETTCNLPLQHHSNHTDVTAHQSVTSSDETAHRTMHSGTIGLISDTAYKVVGTTETMHKSIAKAPFNLLKSIPVVKELALPIETAHNGISESVYRSIKLVSKKIKHLNLSKSA